MNTQKPLIAITMGDAAGIGPEVVAKALMSQDIFDICRPLVIGEKVAMHNAIDLIKWKARLHVIHSVEDVSGQNGVIDLLDLHNLEEKDILVGQICPACGKAAVEFIIKAAQLALHHEVSAIVTAPINKEATRQAGFGELGHLELLAHYTNAKEYATMLVSDPLRVVHLTTHYSLKEAVSCINEELILARLKLTQESFQTWGMEHPRIAVAALNPHGGEGGIFRNGRNRGDCTGC